MGHGDWLTIADANFPAASVAATTVTGTALRMDCDADRAVQAVLSLLPIDGYESDPVNYMQVVDNPDAVPDVVAAIIPRFQAEGVTPVGIERFAFYDKARQGFAILRTIETRPYGNFIIRKGVINP